MIYIIISVTLYLIIGYIVSLFSYEDYYLGGLPITAILFCVFLWPLVLIILTVDFFIDKFPKLHEKQSEWLKSKFKK